MRPSGAASQMLRDRDARASERRRSPQKASRTVPRTATERPYVREPAHVRSAREQGRRAAGLAARVSP